MLPSGSRKLLALKHIQQPDEKPEMYFKPKVQPTGLPPSMRCISKPAAAQPPKLQPCEDFFHRLPLQQVNDRFQNINNSNNNNPFLMGSDVTMSTTMPTELMNKMMGCPQQKHQQQPLQARFNPFEEVPVINQSFYERNLKFQQHQQQMQSMKRDFCNNSTGFSSNASTSSSSLSAYEASLQQQYSMMTPTSSLYGSRYEPPKPDTPPSKPLWLDPVWNCDGNFLDNRSNGSNNNNLGGGFGNSDSVRLKVHFGTFL